MNLSSLAIAVQGVGFGPRSMALQGFADTQLARGEEVFDAPYAEYVKRINAERVEQWRREKGLLIENDVAIPENEDYDSGVGRVAPQESAIPIVNAVAPALRDSPQAIRIGSAFQPIHKSAVRPAPLVIDDDAAMLAMFMLMTDDD